MSRQAKSSRCAHKVIVTFYTPQGGGYAIRNVSRCWAYETSVLLDIPISNDIPKNDYYDYYQPDYKLHLTVRAPVELTVSVRSAVAAPHIVIGLIHRSCAWLYPCVQPSTMENQNNRSALEDIRNQVLSQLSCIQGAPSVQMQEVPPDWTIAEEDEVRTVHW